MGGHGRVGGRVRGSVEAALPDTVDFLDKGLCKLFEAIIRIVGHNGDMADLATGFVRFTVQMKEYVHFLVKRSGQVDKIVVRVSVGTAQDI